MKLTAPGNTYKWVGVWAGRDQVRRMQPSLSGDDATGKKRRYYSQVRGPKEGGGQAGRSESKVDGAI